MSHWLTYGSLMVHTHPRRQGVNRKGNSAGHMETPYQLLRFSVNVEIFWS